MDDRRAARGPESGFTAAGSAQSGRRSTFPPWARGRSSHSPPPRPEGYVRPRGASPARNRRSPPRRPASRRCRSRSALRRKLSSDMRRSGHTTLARPFHPRKALLIHPPEVFSASRNSNPRGRGHRARRPADGRCFRARRVPLSPQAGFAVVLGSHGCRPRPKGSAFSPAFRAMRLTASAPPRSSYVTRAA